MRRRLAALFVVPALLLSACGGGGSDGKPDKADKSQPSASAPAPAELKPVDTAAPMPQVAGAKGKKADITVPKGDPSGKFVVHPLAAGDGATVKQGDMVISHYTGKVWKGGKDLGSSYSKGGAPQVIPAGSKTLIPAFAQSVVGQKVGGRVLVVAPPDAAFGQGGSQQMGITGSDTLILVLDIDKIIPKMVEGKQAAIPKDLPQISADKPAPATIKIPKADPPKDLVDNVLIEGKGPEVKNGQTVFMQYSGAAWKPNEGKSEAKLFDASWNVGTPFSTPIGQKRVIEGWDKGLVGKKVGSRVELVVPPAMAYGDKQQSDDLPANSTLVFVVDILDAM